MANTLLLTYFGPFPGVPVNPTVALAEGSVRALNTARPDLRVVACELPVSYNGSSTALRTALQDVQPDALISLGVAVGRDVVSLEQVAINLDSAGIEDNYVCNHVFYEGQRISRELGLSIPAGFVHVPATCADGEETTEDTGMTAHRDAGGVVRDEQGIPQLPESTVVRIIAEVASDTLPAVN